MNHSRVLVPSRGGRAASPYVSVQAAPLGNGLPVQFRREN